MYRRTITWLIVMLTLISTLNLNYSSVIATPVTLNVTHIIINGYGSRPFMVRDTSTWYVTDYETLQDAVDYASAGGSSIIQFGDGEDPIVTMTNAVPLIAKNNAVFTGNLKLGYFTNNVDGSFTIPDGVTVTFEDLYFENSTSSRFVEPTTYSQGSVTVNKGGILIIQGDTTIIHTGTTNYSSAIYNSGNVKMKSGLISVYGNGISNLTPDATVDQTAGIEITGGRIISSNGYPIYVNNSNVYTLISIKNAVIEQTDSQNGNPAIYSTETAIPTITIYESAQIYSKRLGNLPGVIVMAVPNRTNASVLSGNGTYGSIIYKNESDASQLTIHHTYHARTLLSGATRDTTSDSYLTGPITGLNGIKNATLKVDRIIYCEGQTTYSEQFKNWSNTANTYQNAVTNPGKISTILGSLPEGSENIYPNFYCAAKTTKLTFEATSGTTDIPLIEDTNSTTPTAVKLKATVLNSISTFDLSFLKDFSGIVVKDSNNAIVTSPINALPLKVGVNTFTYTATAQDGTIKTYIIEITREAATLADPVISPSLSNIKAGTEIEITHTEAGTTLYYTTDGSDPATSTTRKVYTGPFPMTESGTIKTYATKDGMISSNVISQAYTIDPVKPAAPAVTADDDKNVITGLDLNTMEYSLDGGKTWLQTINPDLSGNLSVQVRYKAQGSTPASDAVILNFTMSEPIPQTSDKNSLRSLLMLIGMILFGFGKYTQKKYVS